MNDKVGHRRDRVAEAVKQQLAEALITKVKDPRVGLVSISHVDVSADFSHATIMVTVMGSDEEKAEAMAGLESARGFLRTLLAHRLQMRTTPELHFNYDHGIAETARILDLLDNLKDENQND